MILYLILCNEDLSPILEAIGWCPVILTEVLLGGGQWLSTQKDVMNTRARSNGLLLKESYCAKKAVKTFVATLPI